MDREINPSLNQEEKSFLLRASEFGVSAINEGFDVFFGVVVPPFKIPNFIREIKERQHIFQNLKRYHSRLEILLGSLANSACAVGGTLILSEMYNRMVSGGLEGDYIPYMLAATNFISGYREIKNYRKNKGL